MKTKLTLLKSLIVGFWCVLLSTSGYSQTSSASVQVILKNDAQVSPTEYQFDLYMVSLSPDTTLLAGHQYGINYNAAIKPAGATLTASWVAGSTQLSNPLQINPTFNTATNASQIRMSPPSAPGALNASRITGVNGVRIGRVKLVCSAPFAYAQPNFSFNTTVSNTTNTRSTVSTYINGTNTPLCNDGVSGNPSASCVGTVTYILNYSNPFLTPNNCTFPVGSGSVSHVSCLSGADGAIDLTVTGGGPAPFSYAWSNGATTEDLSGLTAGTYSVIISPDGGFCNDTVSFVVNDGTTPITSNTTVASVCDTYTWTINNQTYTASGTYSVVNGCHTEILALTITPSTSNTSVVSECDSYTWAVDGETYSQSGSYTAVIGCNTEILQLTITPTLTVAPGAIVGQGAACLPGVGGSTTFSVPAVANATVYTWTAPAGFTISAGQGTNSITVSWTGSAIQSGISGQLCVTAGNSCGTTPVTCLPISYQITKPVTPPSISGPGKLCPGETATFSITTVARASSYAWTVPAGMSITAGQGSNIITVSVVAGYAGGSVTVSASNVCGSSPVRSKSVTTNPPTTPGAISGQGSGLCNAVGVVYSVASSSSATGYNWAVTGGTIVSGQGSNAVTVDFGVFTTGSITVQSQNGCGSSSLRSLSLRGAPSQPSVISGLTSVCAPSLQPYSVATATGASNYNWTHTFAGTVANGQGTKNIQMSWNVVAANQSIAVSASNACGTSPIRGLSGIQVTSCARSFENEGAFTLTAFPNPASDRVTIVFNAPKDGDYRMTIVDLSGRLMFAQELDILSGVSQMDLDLSGYAAGMYLVSLENGQEIQNIRLIVE